MITLRSANAMGGFRDSPGGAQPHLSRVLHAERLSRAELVDKSSTYGIDFDTRHLINDGQGYAA
ncbi:hypothetical protein QM716_21125 [Rhodococcus sp. IEGM 1409]|uniref:hypothetical protein n=1 Tax=Rhodococcus sp. IEGM 1409 TaxID=3047082 RepID=UPI0024B67BDA|nr:hypothetical protein [Rhodococcus sp. IEGM 1409]MDI9902363.1 hypothetical protein [Rhodococcus sp. IEGM 1409]